MSREKSSARFKRPLCPRETSSAPAAPQEPRAPSLRLFSGARVGAHKAQCVAPFIESGVRRGPVSAPIRKSAAVQHHGKVRQCLGPANRSAPPVRIRLKSAEEKRILLRASANQPFQRLAQR